MSLSAFADSVFPNYVGAVGSLTVGVGGCRGRGGGAGCWWEEGSAFRGLFRANVP